MLAPSVDRLDTPLYAALHDVFQISRDRQNVIILTRDWIIAAKIIGADLISDEAEGDIATYSSAGGRGGSRQTALSGPLRRSDGQNSRATERRGVWRRQRQPWASRLCIDWQHDWD